MHDRFPAADGAEPGSSVALTGGPATSGGGAQTTEASATKIVGGRAEGTGL